MVASGMNERFRELALQAGLESQPAKLKIYKNDDGTTTSGEWEYPLQKFAELIVKEGADLFEIEYGNSEVSGNEVATVLKQHFGVQE